MRTQRTDSPPIIPPPRPIPEGVLHGKVIVVLRRVSGAGQVGNASSEEQNAALTRYVHSLGGGVLPMDENAPPSAPAGAKARAVSGRDLGKREVANLALDLIDAGVAHGLSWYDAKRLSRDEFIIDPNVIVKRLAAQRAVLVTHNAVVRPWDKEDRFRFHIDAALAGRDVVDIRDTFFRGIFGEAAKRPFFGSVPAVGYTTVLREEKGQGPTRIKRDPVKNPEHAALMADLVAWMDTCVAAVEVAARVNAGYHQLVGQRGDRRRRRRGLEGAAVWSAQNLAYILKNPKYWGDWSTGRAATRRTPSGTPTTGACSPGMATTTTTGPTWPTGRGSGPPPGGRSSPGPPGARAPRGAGAPNTPTRCWGCSPAPRAGRR